MNEPVGFYGKLPSVGDFVQRQLPPAFVEIWDRHFQRALETARRELGEQWSTAWEQGAAWRFVLPPGICGERAWCGVTGPAVDRTGRGFPMVLAAPCGGDIGGVLRHGAWFDSLEQIYLAARYEVASVESFAARVSSLAGLPAEVTDSVGPASVWEGLDWEGEEWQLVLPEDGAEGIVLTEAWRQSGMRRGARCLWWTRGAARVLATRGLPRSYASLLVPLAGDTHRVPLTVIDSMGRRDAAEPFDAVAFEEGALREADAPRDPLDNDAMDNTLHAQPDVPVVPLGTECTDGALQSLGDGRTLLLSADDGSWDPRRQAAQRIREAARTSAPDLASLRITLTALHPWLRNARNHPHEPVLEEGAALAACFQAREVRVLRIGSAAAWHWRHGRLRPLFVECAAGAGGDFDDLLFGAAWQTMPGLGTAGEPDCDEACAALEEGDRLLLLATRALAQLPRHRCVEALSLATAEDARMHLAACAGLEGDPAQWPLAVVEIGALPLRAEVS
jgi:type VI secretion system protein ImpM